VARNLEAALRQRQSAFRALADRPAATRRPRSRSPAPAREPRLKALAQELGLQAHVHFTGRLDRDAMAALYRQAPMIAQPQPGRQHAQLGARGLASGVPVVSTDVGGVPFLLRQEGVTGLLVPPAQPQEMAASRAAAAGRDPLRCQRLVDNGLREVQRYTWDCKWPLLLACLPFSAQRASRHAGLKHDSAHTPAGFGAAVPAARAPEVARHGAGAPRDWNKANGCRKPSCSICSGSACGHCWPTRRPRCLTTAICFAAAAFDLAAMRSVADLRHLPFLTKALIRANDTQLAHRQAVGLGRSSTGGSSGEPLVFGLGRQRVTHDVAAKWRATRWWGVDIGDPEVVLWASPIELGAQDRMRRCATPCCAHGCCRPSRCRKTKLDQFLQRIRAMRPRMLFGYPSALLHVARHAERRGQAMHELGIRVAFTTGERLYDEQRTTIGRVFGCQVANGYGGRDAGFIAHECPAGGLHVTAEDIIVELVGPDGAPVPPGQPGEVVVTHLASSDYPFIRYRTGDVAVMQPGLLQLRPRPAAAA
jgi:phenylacetate-CoA ligase